MLTLRPKALFTDIVIELAWTPGSNITMEISVITVKVQPYILENLVFPKPFSI